MFSNFLLTLEPAPVEVEEAKPVEEAEEDPWGNNDADEDWGDDKPSAAEPVAAKPAASEPADAWGGGGGDVYLTILPSSFLMFFIRMTGEPTQVLPITTTQVLTTSVL